MAPNRKLKGLWLHADQQDVRVRMNLRWGVMPFRLDFSPEPEQNIQRTFQLLQRRSLVASGDLVVVVSGCCSQAHSQIPPYHCPISATNSIILLT